MSQWSYTEDSLVEKPAIALFQKLEYECMNCYKESFGDKATIGRETSAEVVLKDKLLDALTQLNHSLPLSVLELALEELTKDRKTTSLVEANREVYDLLKHGVKVTFNNDEMEEVTEVVTVIDWKTPKNNDFFLASQFWVSGDVYKKRADLIGFVNGIPLVFIELKASHKRLANAYRDNLRDYKNTIPQLFWYNAVIMLSNGSQTKVGTITSGWEHFADWKKINDEGEEGIVSLETAIRGICDKDKLLDIVENFILYDASKGSVVKLIAKNHQFLGVNKAITSVGDIKKNQGKLGVFWHTQGSGKSYSMVFFAQKVFRKIKGNWTFLLVTDRTDLDDQIYKNFSGVGAVIEPEKLCRAESCEHLQQLLNKEDHRYLFTLIQKFQDEKGKPYPVLSERSDIIVITDEAHRSQYDTLALNMRNALPNAAFIAFTGTPLIAGEEKTKDVFGDYISVYNFTQAIEDKATVPIYYENRIPELQLINDNVNNDIAEVIEQAELDEEQENKLEREFAREYHLITREDRLDKVAEDVVSHFMNRGYMGKAMFVAIDKVTAIKMYDKVQKYWQRYLSNLREQYNTCSPMERPELAAKIRYMEETDMAVVVSSSQNEVEDYKAKGVDILPHRLRMKNEDLETNFKNAEHPFRIVFVCAMWIVGFDVPSLSTLYLDKPMKNHTLMQTIARVNRVFGEKNNGLIVDYVGVFRNLQKALSIYASGQGNGDTPVQDKQELVKLLKQAIADTTDFLISKGISLERLFASVGFDHIREIDDAIEVILDTEESKKKYISLSGNVLRLFKAILPDPSANNFVSHKALFAEIADKIRSLAEPVYIDGVMNKVEMVLDQSIDTTGYIIRDGIIPIDLSGVDFDKLREQFKKGRKRTEIERLKATLQRKVEKLVKLNKGRMDYQQQLEKMIEEYNTGCMNAEVFFDKLAVFTQRLTEEEKRSIAEQLTEEQLAVFDILVSGIELTDKEKNEVKKAARDLLDVLKKEKLVLDWRKRQQSRAQVRIAIEDVLEEDLPRVYDTDIYYLKCDAVYEHVYDNYYGQGQSVYAG